MRALNMHAGNDKFSNESMVVAAEALREKYNTNGVVYKHMYREHITSNGDYSAELLMHAADLEYVTPKEWPLLLNTREPSSVSKAIISLRSLRSRTVSCATQNRRAPSLSQRGLLRDAVAVLMDREALARVKQEAASSGTDTISKDSGPDAPAASEHGDYTL